MEHRTKFIRPKVEVISKERGVVQAVVSTEDMDRDGDVIRQDHWKLDHFKSHPILLSSHNYRGLRNQIGEWTEMGVVDGKLVGTAKYYIKRGNEEADWGFFLASRGRAAFSVGFVPDMNEAKQIDAHGNLSYEFRGQELLEVSQVTVPSNPSALQTLKGMEDLNPVVKGLVGEMLEDLEQLNQAEAEEDFPPKRKPKAEDPFPVSEIAQEVVRLIKADLEVAPQEDAKPLYVPRDKKQTQTEVNTIVQQAIRDSLATHKMEEN